MNRLLLQTRTYPGVRSVRLIAGRRHAATTSRWVLACFLLLGSGAASIPAHAASPKASWTVMVFMNAKNNLEEDAIHNFLQIANVGSTPAVNVVVEMGRPKKHYDSSFDGWSKTLRFRVTKDMTPIVSNAVVDLGDTDMGDGRSLAAFVEWARATYPAERYMLVLWDHGQGWRFKLSRSFQLKSTRVRAADDVPSDDIPVQAGFRSISHDDDTNHTLYNRDIQDSLKRVLAGAKLDIMSFDACLMGMVETAYAMREVAQVMVGSEELEPGAGWDYSRWLPPLVADPGMDAAKLSGAVVDAYKAAYRDIYLTTLSAVDLTTTRDLASAISELATASTSVLPQQAKAVRKARAACFSYGRSVRLNTSVDLRCVIDSLDKEIPSLSSKTQPIRAALKRFVLHNYASARIRDGYGSDGIAIYFPPDRKAFENDKANKDGYLRTNTVMPVEFVQKEEWSSFLHAYFQLSP